MNKVTFAVVVGNRGFFPDQLAREGRQDILDVLKKKGFGVVAVSSKDTKYGAVETFAEVKICTELFRKNAEKIDGLIVTLPNFGEERGILEVIRRAELNVPVLIQAEPDDAGKMDITRRRDSFCGKISSCNNLRQAGIPYTLTQSHTVSVNSPEFENELDNFAAVCRIVRGLKNLRLGALGARPTAFNTVRYSEKILALSGIEVETLDLSEVLGRISRLSDNDRGVKNKLNSIKTYISTGSIPDDLLLRMAKFGYVVDQWIKATELDAVAVQCWTSVEEFYGIVPCTLMSMLSNSLVPAACEVDITGALAMYVLQLASGNPSALMDWNNNYGDDPNKCVLFHCSNLPKAFFKSAKMDYQEIIAGTVGKENTYGTVVGRVAPNKATFCRATTDDADGIISIYTGEGEFTNDKLETFGGYGVMKIPNLQSLMQYVCRMGFEHHVAVNICQKADAIAEALSTYMGWEVYRHQ